MFFHNFKYTFKILFKNKSLIFWTFAFPIILGTLFYFAFSDIEKKEQFDRIQIAIIENEHPNEIWNQALKELSEEGENQILQLKYTNIEQAKKLLEEEKISGILILDSEQKLIVKKNGINETILKFAIEEIKQTETMLKNIIHSITYESQIQDTKNSINTTIQKILQMKTESMNNIKDVSVNNMSYTMIEYYTLIAMTCLYGGLLSMIAIQKNLANMGSVGKRSATSPTTKKTMILSSLLASYLIQLIGIILLFLYTIFVLNVDYGNHFSFVVLLTLVGCFAGLSLGIFLASTLKSSENSKTGILLAITMFGCFLSGMMGITMKYVVDKNIPFINRINPANLITDGFYALYYYDTQTRFYHNVIGLLLISCFLIFISILFLRRQTYDNL